MRNLIIILSDHLSHNISSLRNANQDDVIVFYELKEECTYVKHHLKKIAFWFASMRHFAEELKLKGHKVHYIKFNDPENKHNLFDAIKSSASQFNPQKIIITEPSEYRVSEIISNLKSILKTTLDQEIEILEDDRFLCSKAEFSDWANKTKQHRMEYFYRNMRKKYKILMTEDGKPVGEKWNYDSENRKPPAKGMISPARISHKKDSILLEVLELVNREFKDNFGRLEPFYFALNRKQALIEAEHFIEKLLPYFGEYQDAMVLGQAYLYHSLLSTYINAGLLMPLELCKMAEKAYYNGFVKINAAEGFIRQILGWREYVRGIYWHYMPEYKDLNYFKTSRPLPEFYWNAKTEMACLKEVVNQTIEHAYSHHIQRLMITGNFALLTELDVTEVCNWYLMVYADAYDWVELPNTLGMALHGDGGIMASKPYAASGKYINKMSNFCKSCQYDPAITIGDNACPFNSLYWRFVDKNSDKLSNNQRMFYVYNTWNKMTTDKQQAIVSQANKIIDSLG